MLPVLPDQVIGHLAAARTTAKLNLISSRFFPLPAGVRAPLAAMANAGLVAGEAAAVAAAEPSAQGPGSTAAVEPARSTPGSDGLVEQRGEDSEKQVQEARQHGVGEPSRAASGDMVLGASTAAMGGLVHVRHVSVVRWQQPPAQNLDASAAAAAQPLQPQLVLEPGEGFAAAAGFDAAAVQQEVQEQRHGLLGQLGHLLERQQQGFLPEQEQLAAAGAPALQCRQNRVAPPPPPPLPPPPALSAPPAASSHVPGWPNGRGLQQQQQQPPPPPQQQHQQQQQQQPRMMRPLYQVPGAAHPAQQLQLPAQAQQWQLHGGVPPPPPPVPAHGGSQPWAAAAALIPAAQQQPQHEVGHPLALEAEPAPNNNKRAAEGLKARLQGDKRPRQQDGGAGTEGGPADAQPPQQQPPPQQPPPARQAAASGQQQWLEGAPSSICQLAAREASAAGPEVLFLGTGSAEPSKYRAASAIQLRCASPLLPADACERCVLAGIPWRAYLGGHTLAGIHVFWHHTQGTLCPALFLYMCRLTCGQSLLVDCGEGALGALCRSYGTAGALRQVASLGCLWVSHRHAGETAAAVLLWASIY